MSRLTRALVGAALAAAALPAAANASTIEVFDSQSSPPHAFSYTGDPGEINNVRYSEAADGSTIVTDSEPIRIKGASTLDGCRLNGDGSVVCAPNVRPSGIELGDGNDTIRYLASESLGLPRFGGGLDAGSGNDTIFAGIRRNADGVLTILGGSGSGDKVTYVSSSRAVNVSLDNVANDGHSADVDNVFSDVEIVEGSSFADQITGSDADERERFIGGPGNDRLTGLGGGDVFHEGSAPSGSDTIVGGAGIDLVDYSQRSHRVEVHMDDVIRNDGELGELDFIDPNTNDVFGSSAGDELAGGSGANVLIGNGGDDALFGNGGEDDLDGGSGVDFLSGGSEDDVIDSVDNTADTIRCESGAQDALTRDLRDTDATGCEVVNSVGTLALAGNAAKLRLSWTHPRSWKQLRTVTLKLRQRDRVVGRVVIRPRAESVKAAGAVKLVRAKLRHQGGKVTAHLALRYSEKLSGKRLRADVIAVDRNGTKQVERAVATLRAR